MGKRIKKHLERPGSFGNGANGILEIPFLWKVLLVTLILLKVWVESFERFTSGIIKINMVEFKSVVVSTRFFHFTHILNSF